MTFLDHRLNTRYRYGFRGGPQFSTLHKRTRAGTTRSRPLREYPLHRYVADYAMMSPEEKREILDLLWVAMGSAYRFRFRDWHDWQVEDQVLGAGDGTDTPIQLFKEYRAGPYTKRRNITLPYRVKMKAAGVPYTAFSVNPLTGLAAPTTTWPDGDELSASFCFDVRARFQEDYNELSADAPNISTSMIAIVEEFD